jgi:hypothetical protein
VLPRRPGVRFALEALFLVTLAVAAGLAHIRPLYIVIVMAAAWLLVALAEIAAERIDRSPVSYLLPTATRAEQEEEEEERIFRPRPEERTVVAPPAAPEEALPAEEPEEDVEPEPAVAEEEPGESVPVEAPGEDTSEEPARPRRRFRLRRRLQDVEHEPPPPPRHVKLLPRRSTAEPSRASKEVAELFGSSGREDDERMPEETGT